MPHADSAPVNNRFESHMYLYGMNLSRFTTLLVILNISLVLLTERVTRHGYFYTCKNLFPGGPARGGIRSAGSGWPGPQTLVRCLLSCLEGRGPVSPGQLHRAPGSGIRHLSGDATPEARRQPTDTGREEKRAS